MIDCPPDRVLDSFFHLCLVVYAFSLLTEARAAQERQKALKNESHTSPPLPNVTEEGKEEEEEEAKRGENSHRDEEKEDTGEGGDERGEKSNTRPQKDSKYEDNDERRNDEGDCNHAQNVTHSDRHKTTGKPGKESETCENEKAEKVDTMTEKLMDKASDPEKKTEECEGRESSVSRVVADCREKTQQSPTTTENADNTSTSSQEIERAKFLLTQEIENGLNSKNTVQYRE